MSEEKKAFMTTDGFTNFMSRLGMGMDNQFTASNYTYGPLLTRNRQQLEAMYRNSWIVGAVVDLIAEDMTRAGAKISSSLTPEQIQKLTRGASKLGIWASLCQAIKWARLFGGSVAFIVIEGQDPMTPLRLDTIRKGQFKGLMVLDRWLMSPPMGISVPELGPDFGLPMYYDIIGDLAGLPNIKVHYSRLIRFTGIELPYYQKRYENMWGESVVERLLDRLVAFDSATQGAAQLITKAHLRGVGVEGLREALSQGGPVEAAIIKQFDYIRKFQSNEGLTLLDSDDEFWTQSYTFSGLADMILQFGQQLSGATGIPLVRLFGQSPAGLNSTGESDLRTYYDNVNKEQENKLRPGLERVYQILSLSILGKELPDDFDIVFNPLWQLQDREKVDISRSTIDGVTSLYNAGLFTHRMCLQELKQSSDTTGFGSNITDDVIERASDEFDDFKLHEELMAAEEASQKQNPDAMGKGKAEQDAQKTGTKSARPMPVEEYMKRYGSASALDSLECFDDGVIGFVEVK